MFYRSWLLVFLTIPLLIVASPSRGKNDELAASLDKAIKTLSCKASVGVAVYDAAAGSIVYERNADTLFVPASGLKLYTAAAALEILGPAHTLTTQLWVSGEVKAGTLHGNLYLKGGGNPALTIGDLDQIALELKALGITRIEGAVFVDNFAFDGVCQGPGWMWDDAPEYWNSSMDALVVNHSCLTVHLSPGAKEGEPCSIALQPEIGFAKVVNFSKTIRASENSIRCVRQAQKSTNVIEVHGTMPAKGSLVTHHVAVDCPHLFAGHVFVGSLTKAGINVSSKDVEARRVAEDARCILEHRSRPIAELVQKMMKDSDNLYADCLFKAAAYARYKTAGSWSLGSRAVREVLQKRFALITADMAILDGSGLSRYNLTSPRQLASFLLAAQKDFPYFAELQASIPFYHDHFVRAKSGTMQGIKTLSGFMKTEKGQELIFSVMINGFLEPRPVEDRLEDKVIAILKKY